MPANYGMDVVRGIFAVRRALERKLDFGELTHGEYLVLRRIYKERSGDGEIRVFKALSISEGLGMPPPALSRLLNGLEGKKLISRTINADNRRSVIIDLTEAGGAALKRADEQIARLASGIEAGLRGDAERLARLLERLEAYCGEDDRI